MFLILYVLKMVDVMVKRCKIMENDDGCKIISKMFNWNIKFRLWVLLFYIDFLYGDWC